MVNFCRSQKMPFSPNSLMHDFSRLQKYLKSETYRFSLGNVTMVGSPLSLRYNEIYCPAIVLPLQFHCSAFGSVLLFSVSRNEGGETKTESMASESVVVHLVRNQRVGFRSQARPTQDAETDLSAKLLPTPFSNPASWTLQSSMKSFPAMHML